MKDTFKNIMLLLSKSNGPTRFVLILATVMIIAITSLGMWRSSNPQMKLLRGNLDGEMFGRITKALGGANISWEPGPGDGPYSLLVDNSRYYEALNTIAEVGGFMPGARGVDINGGSSVMQSSVERTQRARARHWQEVEMQLERLTWVYRAKIISANPVSIGLSRRAQSTVSVVLTPSGYKRPTLAQSRGAQSLVANAFSVNAAQVAITDDDGRSLVAGNQEQGYNAMLQFQIAFDEQETRKAQEVLDSTFGPGVALVNVKSDWSFERTETLAETIDPQSESVLSSRSRESVKPSPATVGGPAGVQANIGATPIAPSIPTPATQTETETSYTYGTNTTHKVQVDPLLTRLSVSLVLDSSRETEIESASSTVKALVGFDEARGDLFSGEVLTIFGLNRDAEGVVMVPEPLSVPTPPSATTTMLVEWGLEALAGIALLVVLFKSLKSSKQAAMQSIDSTELDAAVAALQASGSGSAADDQARRHVEELLEADPERVGALLSRWAMGEDYYQDKAKV